MRQLDTENGAPCSLGLVVYVETPLNRLVEMPYAGFRSIATYTSTDPFLETL